MSYKDDGVSLGYCIPCSATAVVALLDVGPVLLPALKEQCLLELCMENSISCSISCNVG
jgi:hypothetical protein